MIYSIAKLMEDNNYCSVVDIMDGFYCMCSLMTKVSMIGENLPYGDYLVYNYDEETEEVNSEIVIIVDEEGIDFVDAEAYFE